MIMLNEKDIRRALRSGEINLPPLEFREIELRSEWLADKERSPWEPDAIVQVTWGARSFDFEAELKSSMTPKAFAQTIQKINQVSQWAQDSKTRPLIISSYLSPKQLAQLEEEGISGVDLSGNGIVIVPDEVIVFRTGNPNKFPADRTIKNVFRGASSLVARVFLMRQQYDTVQQVADEILSRKGQITLPTVSKALKTLEESLIVRRDGRQSALLQPDELLDRLSASYEPPKIGSRKQYRWKLSAKAIQERLKSMDGQIVQTGAGSAEYYTALAREETIQCYCDEIEQIEQQLQGCLEETRRFPDFELIETSAKPVYFDPGNQTPIPAASIVQTWLELQAGDKRQRDAAATLRNKIIVGLREDSKDPK